MISKESCLLVRFELLLANYLNNRLEKRFIRETRIDEKEVECYINSKKKVI